MTKRPGINERIESLSSVKEAQGPRAKAGAMADQYRRVAGRNGATGDDALAAQYGRRAEVLDKIANGVAAPAASPAPAAKPKSGKRASPADPMSPAGQAARYAKAAGMKSPAFRAVVNDHLAANGAPSLPKSASMAAVGAHLEKHLGAARAHEVMGKIVNGDFAAKAPASRTLDIGGRVKEGVAAKLDPANIIEKRNETARSLADQAKFTGVDAGRGAAARDLVSRNTADLARMAPIHNDPMIKDMTARSTVTSPADLNNRLAAARGTNDAHMGTTSHAAPPPASPPSAPKEPMLSRLSSAYGKAQTGLTLMAAGAQGAHAFSEDRAAGGSVAHAAYEGMKAAAPSAAIAGAQPLAHGLHAFGDGALALSGELMKQTGLADMVFLDLAIAKGAVVTGAAGVAAKGAGTLLSAAGKVALPAAAAVGAFQGAREDQNRLRGAGRGVVRSLDPTGIVTGLTGHGAGLGERIYDAAFGKAQARFKAAAAPAESQVASGKKGWANPKVQAAAQQAKGNTYNGPTE